MPRKGKGMQAVRTATDQQYGQAKAQEEAQMMTPLPMMERPAPSAVMPGQLPFAGPSKYPNRDISTPSSLPDPVMNQPTDEMAQAKAASLIPVLEAVASLPGASASVRNLARVARQQLGDSSKVGVPLATFKDE